MQATTIMQKAATPNWMMSVAGRISSFPALIIAVIVAKVFWSCRDRIADPDLWWHLRNAQYLVTNLRLPNVDMYSFTAAGSPWINHEWLSELFYYAAFRAFGLRGIFVVFASALAILLVAVFRLCMKETPDPFVAAVATIVGGLLAMAGFGPRTQTFGWLCFIAVFAILLRFRSTRRAPLWLLPPIFCLWINCHGGWPIGVAVLALFIIAGLVPRDIGRLTADPWSGDELKKLVLIGTLSIAALFVNPYGYRLVEYPFDVLFRQGVNLTNVEEWAPVNFQDERGKQVAAVLGAVFALTLVGRKRWRVDDALLTAFVLYCGLTHVRLLMLTGLVLPPILAPQVGRISSYDERHERWMLNSALLAITVAVFFIAFPSARRLDQRVADLFPRRAVEFLREHPQQARIFNWYEWGGYLEWNLPGEQAFIDSRTDIFEYKGILRDYLDTAMLRDSQEILARHEVSYVLFPVEAPLSYHLSKLPEWQCIYRDGQAVIFRAVQH